MIFNVILSTSAGIDITIKFTLIKEPCIKYVTSLRLPTLQCSVLLLVLTIMCAMESKVKFCDLNLHSHYYIGTGLQYMAFVAMQRHKSVIKCQSR